MDSYLEKIISNVQSGLHDLTKALHELTLTIQTHKGELDTALAMVKLETGHLKQDLEQVKNERRSESVKTSDRVFDIFKTLLPWIMTGLVAYLGFKK